MNVVNEFALIAFPEATEYEKESPMRHAVDEHRDECGLVRLGSHLSVFLVGVMPTLSIYGTHVNFLNVTM